MAKPDVSAAIKAALTEPEGSEVEDTAPAAEVPAKESEGAPDSQEVKDNVEPEPKPVPTSVFGVDLTVLPDDEARQKFIDEFQEANKTINKLQREVAELKKEPSAPTPAPEPESELVDVSQLTDEQIADALGINLSLSDSPERDQREVALTRTLLEMQQKQEKLEKGFADRVQVTTWEQSFDDLEIRYGTLPEGMTRDDVRGWAAEQGISQPEAAYWAAVGPVRTAVTQALQAKVVELKTSKKKAATTPRPKTSADVDPNRLQSKTVKAGIKEAFELARQELGITLADD